MSHPSCVLSWGVFYLPSSRPAFLLCSWAEAFQVCSWAETVIWEAEFAVGAHLFQPIIHGIRTGRLSLFSYCCCMLYMLYQLAHGMFCAYMTPESGQDSPERLSKFSNKNRGLQRNNYSSLLDRSHLQRHNWIPKSSGGLLASKSPTQGLRSRLYPDTAAEMSSQAPKTKQSYAKLIGSCVCKCACLCPYVHCVNLLNKSRARTLHFAKFLITPWLYKSQFASFDGFMPDNTWLLLAVLSVLENRFWMILRGCYQTRSGNRFKFDHNICKVSCCMFDSTHLYDICSYIVRYFEWYQCMPCVYMIHVKKYQTWVESV